MSAASQVTAYRSDASRGSACEPLDRHKLRLIHNNAVAGLSRSIEFIRQFFDNVLAEGVKSLHSLMIICYGCLMGYEVI